MWFGVRVGSGSDYGESDAHNPKTQSAGARTLTVAERVWNLALGEMYLGKSIILLHWLALNCLLRKKGPVAKALRD